ncbi:hypothetical protein PN36_24005 [Candidatus Thiomargarita nelsonii]|uniref:Uncharacterized protein n=1 Tax=Candidatus Thiomargarita nelsonii TaxID=1003181 RepID=A0A0A6P8J8_9GAMM|nr:hypothetical protein PN36_24005 [Candidatus Thiomargarita nelsonii]
MLYSGQPKTKKQHPKIMLTPQQKKLFQRLSTDRQQNAKILKKSAMIGIQTGVIEKYSDQAHFIDELLQNADDVKATHARFILNQTGLIFAHNGSIHFGITDPHTEPEDLGHINAITSIGQSNKQDTQIGKFGLGFKAVFQYTHAPEIYDPPFCFKIENFIVPRLLSRDHPNRQTKETLFYIPFHSPTQAFPHILEKLKNLNHALLFLKYLTQITWTTPQTIQKKYIKTIKPFSDTTAQITIQAQKTQHFLVFSDHAHSIAYRLSQPQPQPPTQILYEQRLPIYCFFPTKEITPLRFILHAPFLLTDSRETIKQNEGWNKKLIQALAQLTVDSLNLIKSLNMLTEEFFNVLPINEADFPTQHLLRALYESVLTHLQSDKPFLPTQSGDYTTRNNAYLAENPALINLLTSEQLSQLVKNKNAQWVFPQTTAPTLRQYVKHHLINQALNSDKLVRCLTKSFIQAQTDDWLIQLYTYLLLEKAHQNELLKTKPILRLKNGKIVSAYNRAGKIQVYFPTEHPSDYPTLKPCFVKHEKSLQFLQALGIDKPKAYEEIKFHILPKYQQNGEITPAEMHRDFQKLLTYFLNCTWRQKKEYLNQLKNLAFCRVRYFADNTIARVAPEQVYFKTDKLINYFKQFPTIYFLESEFYQAYEKKHLKSFFKALGVADKPRLIKIKPNLSARAAIHQGHCTHDYYHFLKYTYDYDIEGLNAFISDMTLEKSKNLWHFLIKLIKDNQEQDIFKGQYHWFYRRDRYYYFEAKFLNTLRQNSWLYNHHHRLKATEISLPQLALNYDTHSEAAQILIEKLEIQSLKAPTGKRAQLEEQLAQKIEALDRIEILESNLIETEKYSIKWFKLLLELEYLHNQARTRMGKKMRLKFSKIEPNSERILILKNPTRYIPSTLEDIADLSLELNFGTKTQNLMIDIISVKESSLGARLKLPAKGIDFKKVQSAVIEIKNPSFLLEHLKKLFRQLPDEDNLQSNLTEKIEFIFGPPGTGKTTYLAQKKILPLMQKDLKILVLTPTNKVADVIVRKMMPETEWLIRFGVTGDKEIEAAGLLKEKSFKIKQLKKCVLVTTIARFLYDGFSTCKLKDYKWDIILFDEASMIMLAQIAYVLYQQKHCRFIVAGDPFQIQPVVLADAWKAENIYSLVELNNFQSPQTVPHNFPITRLTTQYRSLAPVGKLFSQFSYFGLLDHHRKQRIAQLEGFNEITLIKFPVNPFNNIYRSQRIDGGGAYHIYSAILTVELALFLSKQTACQIGIVCPYMTQATLVEKMIAAQQTEPEKIVTGTVHRFQGDEFDIILNLFNAPPQISPNIFLNKQNILNVAISRAKDYLIMIIPDIEGLDKIKRLETILKGDEFKPYFQEFSAAEIEKIIFKQSNYIDENAFIVPHQKVNVYGKAVKKYEVRMDDKAVDILLGV